MYLYEDIKKAKSGSVVQYLGTNNDYLTKDKLYYLVTDGMVIRDDGKQGSCSKKVDAWKLVKTKPGIDAQKDDHVIVIADHLNTYTNDNSVGTLGVISNIESPTYVRDTTKPGGWYTVDLLVLCQPIDIYLYDDDRDPVENDIVVYTHGSAGQTYGGGHETGKLYVVKSYVKGGHIHTKNKDTTDNDRRNFKILKTKSGDQVKTGDTVICVDNANGVKAVGDIFHKVERLEAMLRYKPGFSDNFNSFRVLITIDFNYIPEEDNLGVDYVVLAKASINKSNNSARVTKGKLYVVTKVINTPTNMEIHFNNDVGEPDWLNEVTLQPIKTKPGDQTKVGDKIVRIDNGMQGATGIATNVDGTFVVYARDDDGKENSGFHHNCLVICTS